MKHLVPSEASWNDYCSDLDCKYAHDLYIGRSNSEMSEHFRTGPIEAFDELLIMPKEPFQYYLRGFRDSVLERKHLDEFDMASAAACFLRLVEIRCAVNISDVLEVLDEFLPAIEYISEHQHEFEADVDIHGSFMEKRAKILALCKRA